MPGDLHLSLRVRADMQEALQGIGALNRSLGDTARRGDEAGAALAGAAGSTQAFGSALGTLGRESESTLGQARAAAESAFGTMESALTRFITTGETSFSSFVDSVIADLARIATRRFIIQPLANALFGAFGDVSSPGADLFGRLQADVNHAGGAVGAPGGVRRAVHPAIFSGAERLHGGGIAGLRADEVPIIAQRGETIIPRGALIDPRAFGATPSVEITFENRGTPQREVSREVRFDPRGLIVTVVTDDLRRGGPIRQTLARELGAPS